MKFKNIDELLRIKTKEHPDQNYWDAYWARLSSRLKEPAPSGIENLLRQLLHPVPVAAAAVVITLFIGFALFYKGPKEIIPANLEVSLKGVFSDIEDSYKKQELDTFLSYFSEEEKFDFAKFKKDMRQTFADYNNLDVKVTLRSVVVKGDTAIAKVNWSKGKEGFPQDSGSDTIIKMKKKDGDWKITDIANDSMFVIREK